MGSLFSKSISLRKSVKISDDEFVQLRDFIYEKSGIYVDVRRKYLFESRFSGRLGELGLQTFADYTNYLKFDSKKDLELKKLFELKRDAIAKVVINNLYKHTQLQTTFSTT